MKLTRGYLQLIVLAVFGGVGSWLIAHYQQLIPDRWETFTSPDGTFSVDLPAKVTSQEKQPASNTGKEVVHLIGARTGEGRYYGCAYFTYFRTYTIASTNVPRGTLRTFDLLARWAAQVTSDAPLIAHSAP